MKLNTELIEKTLLYAKNEILDICTSDNLTISSFESKIKQLEYLSMLKLHIFYKAYNNIENKKK